MLSPEGTFVNSQISGDFSLWRAVTNDSYQRKIAEETASRVIAAIEKFHTDKGEYPKTLDDLVPQYLTYVPQTKICLDGQFLYYNNAEHPMLVWAVVPPFGRKIDTFEDRRWGYID
jgi:hypothetical protein